MSDRMPVALDAGRRRLRDAGAASWHVDPSEVYDRLLATIADALEGRDSDPLVVGFALDGRIEVGDSAPAVLDRGAHVTYAVRAFADLPREQWRATAVARASRQLRELDRLPGPWRPASIEWGAVEFRERVRHDFADEDLPPRSHD